MVNFEKIINKTAALEMFNVGVEKKLQNAKIITKVHSFGSIQKGNNLMRGQSLSHMKSSYMHTYDRIAKLSNISIDGKGTLIRDVKCTEQMKSGHICL